MPRRTQSVKAILREHLRAPTCGHKMEKPIDCYISHVSSASDQENCSLSTQCSTLGEEYVWYTLAGATKFHCFQTTARHGAH